MINTISLGRVKDKISKSTSKSQQYCLIGITGLVVVLFSNMLAQLFIVETNWWSVWFPNYAVWLTVLVAGRLMHYKEDNIDLVL